MMKKEEALFYLEFFRTEFDIEKAAINAGYPAETAEKIGKELLLKPDIRDKIEELINADIVDSVDRVRERLEKRFRDAPLLMKVLKRIEDSEIVRKPERKAQLLEQFHQIVDRLEHEKWSDHSVLALLGSPRISGNTALLAQTILTEAASWGAKTEMIRLNDLNIHGCQSCYWCRNNTGCRLQDDIQQLFPKILQCDALILASPVYMWQMSSQMKMVIDRFFALMNPVFSWEFDRLQKLILLFTQGEQNAKMYQPYFEYTAKMLTAYNLPPAKIISAAGCNVQGDVLKQTELIAQAQTMGKELF